MSNKVRSIKQAQREKNLLREFSLLFSQISRENDQVRGIWVSKVTLSTDKSTCFIHFYSPEGQKGFETALDALKLYKPSLRTALAKRINGRYVPELVFKFDEHFTKLQQIEALIDRVAKTLPSDSDDHEESN